MFLEVEEGGQDQDEEAVKVRFIADLPLRLVYGLRDCIPLIYSIKATNIEKSMKRFKGKTTFCFFYR